MSSSESVKMTSLPPKARNTAESRKRKEADLPWLVQNTKMSAEVAPEKGISTTRLYWKENVEESTKSICQILWSTNMAACNEKELGSGFQQYDEFAEP